MRAAILGLLLLGCGARQAGPAPLLTQDRLQLSLQQLTLAEDGGQSFILCPMDLRGGPPADLVALDWSAVGPGLSVQGALGPLEHPVGSGRPPVALLLSAPLPALPQPGVTVEVSGTVHLRTGLGTERRQVFSDRLPLLPVPPAPLESP